MNMNLVITVCIVALTVGILVIIAYIVMILSRVKKMLNPVDRMIQEVHNEFKPLLNDMSGMSSSMNNILSRVDRVTKIIFGKIELVGQGADMASSYAQKFVRNPKAELSAISAGLRRGLEVLFRKKGE